MLMNRQTPHSLPIMIRKLITLALLALPWAQAPDLHAAETAPAKYETETDILYREGGNLTDYMRERCRLDVYYPTGVKEFPTVVWFHGGGLTGGERSVPAGLKEKGIAVIAVNYRLNPKVKSPAYVDDAAAAVAWTFKNIEKHGGSRRKIFVSGHSAGGYLTSMIGLDKHWLAAYGIDANEIAGLIPYSGHTITHFTVRAERGIDGKQPVVDHMAPLFHVRKDAPPLLLITGDRELEMLGRYEENAYLWRMMQLVEHPDTTIYELDGYNHGQMAEPAHPLLLRFIRRVDAEQ
jgi:acetyl esterase/lipase